MGTEAGKEDGMLKIVTLRVGLLDTNCYMVFSDETKILYVIDPGGEPDKIVAEARKFRYARVMVLLTHAHVDHIFGLGRVVDKLNANPVFLHPSDVKIYMSPANAVPPFLPVPPSLPTTTGQVSSSEFSILPVPGHSPGSCAFYFPAARALFAGDTLFAGSVGRTDLPGGDWEALEKSIREQIYTLPDDVAVYPGHGPVTAIGAEKATNPYVGR